MPDYDEKTEAPTSKRRQQAREDGNVARSPDLSGAGLLAGVLVMLYIVGNTMFHSLRLMMQSMLGGTALGDPVSNDSSAWLIMVIGWECGKMMLPLMLGICLMGVVANMLQVGVMFSVKAIQPSFGKLNPIKGLSQIFSMRGMMRLAMSMVKVILVSVVAYICIRLDYPKILGLVQLSAGEAFMAASEMVYYLAWKIVAVLLIIALLDYGFQRWQHERDLKMTKQEVKDEMRQMEGDPQVKARRMQVARQLAMQRMAQAVPKADVVVTNPTHYAVALEYKDKRMGAPVVVAKGVDHMALRLRQLAMQHEVPIVEKRELARALYRETEVGQEISPQYYTAVAEILAYVYRLNDQRKRKRPA